jgi:hypothetical protein
MTVGEALKDPTTNLGKAVVQCKSEFEIRKTQAFEIIANQGCTIEEAFNQVWASTRYVA